MKRKISLHTFLMLLLTLVLFAGCASSTMIKSVPSGADVYINGDKVGKTPYLYTDTRVVFSPMNVDIVKEGYETLYVTIRRDEEFNVGAFIGGFIIPPLWLWTLDYKPTRTFTLQPMLNDFPEVAVKEIKYNGTTKLEKLRELKQMLDEKLITVKEYEKLKAQILEEM
jgi:hypothetical protein